VPDGGMDSVAQITHRIVSQMIMLLTIGQLSQGGSTCLFSGVTVDTAVSS